MAESGYSLSREADTPDRGREALEFGRRAGRAAVLALLCEAKTAPKPGLVDPFHNGAHRDMDYPMFLRSARSLGPYFSACAKAGYRCGLRGSTVLALPKSMFRDLFDELRAPGLEAERAMFRATGGINTHKGAIFTLGLLSAAAGLHASEGNASAKVARSAKLSVAAEICLLAGKICSGITERDLVRLGPEQNDPTGKKQTLARFDGSPGLSAGERLYLHFGAKGVRGEAEAGFPVVRSFVFPRLAVESSEPGLAAPRAVKAGMSAIPEARRLDALLASMSILEDSCLLARGGPEGLAFVQRQAAVILSGGGAGSTEGLRLLALLDRDCCARNLSPGGSADMLAAGIFLYMIQA